MMDRDLLVAAGEKIIGWKLRVNPLAEGDFWQTPRGKFYRSYVAGDPQENPGRICPMWNPLALESDAFMLVKALVSRGFGISLHGPFSQDRVSDPNWCCAVYQGEISGVHCDLEPARAITIACLKAVGVNTE